MGRRSLTADEHLIREKFKAIAVIKKALNGEKVSGQQKEAARYVLGIVRLYERGKTVKSFEDMLKEGKK